MLTTFYHWTVLPLMNCDVKKGESFQEAGRINRHEGINHSPFFGTPKSKFNN